MSTDKTTGVIINTKPQLSSNHHKKLVAFRAKYEGQRYQTIAEYLGVPVSTLVTYFSREWKDEYASFAEQEALFEIQEARNIVRSQIRMATRCLVDLIHSQNQSVRLAAVKYLLDRTVGEDFFSLVDQSIVTTTEKLSIERKIKTKL